MRIIITIIIFIPPVVRIPGVKSKNVKNIKASWNGYVPVSSSSKKVSRNKMELKRCTSMLTLWKRNWISSGSPKRFEILRPSSSGKEAVVSLSGPCDSTTTGWRSWVEDSSVLVQRPRLLYDLPRSSRKQLPWCRLWYSMLKVVPPRHGIRVQPSGCFPPIWTLNVTYVIIIIILCHERRTGTNSGTFIREIGGPWQVPTDEHSSNTCPSGVYVAR